ncbi:hypothetical protein [Lentzea sp. NPDC055074]
MIPLADLTAHLEGVRRDLIGFLDLVRRWAPASASISLRGSTRTSASVRPYDPLL